MIFVAKRLIFTRVLFSSTIIIFQIKEQTLMEFILQFKELRLLGDLYFWGVSDKMARNVANKLRSKNWDITLLWYQNCESVVTMNSLRGALYFSYFVNTFISFIDIFFTILELNMSMEWKSLKPGLEKKY